MIYDILRPRWESTCILFFPLPGGLSLRDIRSATLGTGELFWLKFGSALYCFYFSIFLASCLLDLYREQDLMRNLFFLQVLRESGGHAHGVMHCGICNYGKPRTLPQGPRKATSVAEYTLPRSHAPTLPSQADYQGFEVKTLITI